MPLEVCSVLIATKRTHAYLSAENTLHDLPTALALLTRICFKLTEKSCAISHTGNATNDVGGTGMVGFETHYCAHYTA